MKKAAIIACCLLTGCTVGPDFTPPPPPKLSGFTAEGTAQGEGARDVHWLIGKDISAQWWTVFQSPGLDALIKEAFEHNPDLAAAQASLRLAMENVKAQSGAFYPAVTAGLNASRIKQSAQLSPALSSPALLYDLYQTQLSVSWTPDIWGANRRAVEALQAQADAQRYQLQSVYVGLAANVVAAAIQEASLREQISATRDLIADQQRILAIETQQKSLGQISGQEVAAQQTVLAQTEASLPPLMKLLAQQRDLLTILAGRYPADQVPQTFQMRDLTPPKELPLSLASKLVEQRADIRMAEATMHAASAQVGVATANRLPNITLAADTGTVATQLGHLFGAGNEFWSVGAGLTQPIFDGGTLLHRKRAAEAAFDQASASYRSTVLKAFQEVADTLAAIENDARAAQSAEAAGKSAERSLSLAKDQEAAGQVGRLAVLNAETAYLQARIAAITARANRIADSAALFQALGGGWWNRDEQVTGK